MNISEYNSWYMGFVKAVICPAVSVASKNDIKLGKDSELQEKLEVRKNMLIVVNLVAVIEAHFLSGSQPRELRKFEALSNPLPHAVDETHLSCFYYLRDTYAHNGDAVLFPSSTNTTQFLSSVSSGSFPFASVTDQSIAINGNTVHELHLIVLRLFGENV